MEDSNKSLILKHKRQVFPEKLKSVNSADLIQSVNNLCQEIRKDENISHAQFSPERVIKVLVRGLGSSNIQIQKNYFAALVALSQHFGTTSTVSARNILDAVASELNITGNIAKGEEGEILMGRVLAFGVLVRSGALTSAVIDDQVTAVTQLLEDIKAKSYLPLIGDPFFVEYLKQVEEPVFKKVVWPALHKDLNEGPTQSLFIYHMLLVCEERFPSLVSKKFLKQVFISPQVISTATAPLLLNSLKNDFKLKTLNHPVFSDILKYVANAPEEVLISFWQEVEAQLLLDSTPSSNKKVMAIKFFSLIVSHLQNASQVLSLLTPKLLSWFMKKHKINKQFQMVLNNVCREALQNLYKLCINEDDSKTIVAVIKKLLFDTGNILFDQFSGSKVVQLLMSHLKEKSVMKLAKIFQAVITGSSNAIEHRDSETVTRSWHNKEKLYTVHMFCKLISLPATQNNTSWKLGQLTFLFDVGFFPAANIGVELAGLIRESFYSSLNHKFPSLVHLQNILAGIVEHINHRLDNGDQPRVKVTSEMISAWKKMFTTVKQIGEEDKREQWVIAVFQTMFFHIGLHLFKEATFATDVLEELHSVYSRIGSTSSSDEEPHWTEVVVEMFLSLLSRNSQLHRHLIGCIFSHFCPIMIPQNIHQILQVLDPTTNTNPLLESLDSYTESSSENDESDEDEAEHDEESSDDGMADENEEEDDEKVNDRLRRAVMEALGDTGALTDVESVDLEDMDEEEAVRVDKALSLAFKANRQAKTKKQSSHAKALTHFRLRVIDLIEVWLASEPALDLMLDTLLRLLSLLEHSLVDRHQAPLETRLRSIIKKLTSTKKYNVSDCGMLQLGPILKNMLEKGNRTTIVYMNINKELTAATLFIVKASQHVPDSTDITVLSVLKDIIKSFFYQRDCLLKEGIFLELFKLNNPYILSLASKLPGYIFDPSVNPFRRSKALEFLVIFLKDNRILKETNGEQVVKLEKMSKRLYRDSVKMLEEPKGRIQPKFIMLLTRALQVISRHWLSSVDWSQHFKALAKFQSTKQKKNSSRNNNVTDKQMEVENFEENKMESQTESEGTENETNHVKEEMVVATGAEEKISSSEEEMEGSISKKASEESASDSDKQPTKKAKKSEKKRSHEKIKRTHLLKNNSKRLRMESMAVGLEEGVFSNYKMLVNVTTSPER